MSEISFKIQPVNEKPERKNRVTRKNKYEPIIDAFVDSGHSLVRVEGTGLVEVSVRNREVYLEKR